MYVLWEIQVRSVQTSRNSSQCWRLCAAADGVNLFHVFTPILGKKMKKKQYWFKCTGKISVWHTADQCAVGRLNVPSQNIANIEEKNERIYIKLKANSEPNT